MNFLQRSLRSAGIAEPRTETGPEAAGNDRPAGLPIAQVVHAAYKGILQRDVDPSGLRHYTARLAESPQTLAQVLNELLRSAESRRTNRAAILFDGTPLPVDVVSLGTHCFTSAFLKRQGLKRWSGPFDWIFSSIPMVSHCIANRFQLFLDQDFYRPAPPAEQRAGTPSLPVNHAYYLAKYQVLDVFNHHAVHLPQQHDYMRRCVQRFMETLTGPKPLMYLLLRLMEPATLQELRDLSAALQAAGSPHRLVAVLVDHSRPGLQLPQTETLQHDDMLIVHRYFPVSAWHNLNFETLQDEINLACLVRTSVRPAQACA